MPERHPHLTVDFETRMREARAKRAKVLAAREKREAAAPEAAPDAAPKAVLPQVLREPAPVVSEPVVSEPVVAKTPVAPEPVPGPALPLALPSTALVVPATAVATPPKRGRAWAGAAAALVLLGAGVGVATLVSRPGDEVVASVAPPEAAAPQALLQTPPPSPAEALPGPEVQSTVATLESPAPGSLPAPFVQALSEVPLRPGVPALLVTTWSEAPPVIAASVPALVLPPPPGPEVLLAVAQMAGPDAGGLSVPVVSALPDVASRPEVPDFVTTTWADVTPVVAARVPTLVPPVSPDVQVSVVQMAGPDAGALSVPVVPALPDAASRPGVPDFVTTTWADTVPAFAADVPAPPVVPPIILDIARLAPPAEATVLVARSFTPDSPVAMPAVVLPDAPRSEGFECTDCTAEPLRPGDQTIVLVVPQSQTAEAGARQADRLATLGITAGETRAVAFGAAESNVRYFHDGDAAAARAIAQTIDARVVALTQYRPRPPEGTIELRLGPDGPDRASR